MHRLIQIIILILTLGACKEVTNNSAAVEESIPIEPTAAESVALAHGIEHWEKVKELQFTFNVERGDAVFGRSYVWNTKNDDITYMADGDTIKYNRHVELDSLSLKADQRFVNDSFWLLSPYKLVWDEGTTIEGPEKALSPISNDSLYKITLVYGSEGGYTPGDAYDFFYSDDYLIREWVYRRSNSDKPGVITRWSDFTDLEGLKLATVHTDSARTWKLFFTDIAIKK